MSDWLSARVQGVGNSYVESLIQRALNCLVLLVLVSLVLFPPPVSALLAGLLWAAFRRWPSRPRFRRSTDAEASSLLTLPHHGSRCQMITGSDVATGFSGNDI
jgi:hypothetical protein